MIDICTIQKNKTMVTLIKITWTFSTILNQFRIDNILHLIRTILELF